MRIGIEAQRIFRTHKHGMDRVAVELIKNLQVIDTENEYFIFVKPDQDTSVIAATANFTIVEIPGRFYPSWEQYKLPKAAKKYKCDLLHCTSNTAPLCTDIPIVTTLHDIIYLESSTKTILKSEASAYQKFGNLYRKLIVAHVVKKSKSLVTVSNFEKNNINTFFKLNNQNIQTIYNGVNQNFGNQVTEKQKLTIKDKYRLPEQYLLHIANKDPRKNTKRVLIAYKDFIKIAGNQYKLVIMGCNEADLKLWLAEIEASNILEHIILTGYVSETDLPIIYALATLFLFPSLREGFGIPIIEAMVCGVPVITSNVSSMPEVARDAAHLVNPLHPEEITQAIIKILNDTDYKASLRQKGLERSKQFSWRIMARAYLKLYEDVHEKHSKNHKP